MIKVCFAPSRFSYTFQMFTNALVNVNTNLEVNVKHTYSGFFGFASYTLFKIYIIKYT